MESVNYTGSYMETELSDSIVLIEELTDPKGVKGDQLGGSGKLYNSCFIHRRNQRDDEDDDAGEAIAIGMPERGTPDGKSDTDIDDEDVTSSGRRGSNVRVTFYGDDHQIDRHDEDDEEDDEDEDEDEDDEDEDETDEDEDEGGRQGEGEDEDEDDEEDDEEEEEEEEHIEVRTPQWTENRITTSDTASADSNSTSECESKSTSVSFVDDSLLMTTSQPIDGQENSNGMTLTTDYSDLDDKTDFSSFQELTADNDGTNDELEYDGDTESKQKRSKQMDIRGGPNDNKGFDTVDTQLIVHHRRPQKGSNEETVGLLSGEVADKLHQITEEEDDDPLIELACQPLMYLDNPLMGKGVPDDQVSLLTKHSVYQRNSMKLSVGTSTSCSASASSASTSSTSSRTIARRMVKSSGKAVKSFSKKFTKLFK